MTHVILDAHISGPVVGEALEQKGYDVFPIDQHPELKGLPDRDLLELAIKEGRVLVTANVRHFLPLLTEMNAAGRSHASCILVPRSIRSEDFGTLVLGIEEALEVPIREADLAPPRPPCLLPTHSKLWLTQRGR